MRNYLFFYTIKSKKLKLNLHATPTNKQIILQRYLGCSLNHEICCVTRELDLFSQIAAPYSSGPFAFIQNCGDFSCAFRIDSFITGSFIQLLHAGC